MDQNSKDQGVHEGERGGNVQSPSHHKAQAQPIPEGQVDRTLQDPAGNPAVGAAEDRSQRHPLTKAKDPEYPA